MKKSTNEKNILRIFVIVALIFGLMFVYLVPPFQSPDENSHFFKAYTLSTGDVYPVVMDGVYRFKLPKAIVNYAESYNKKMGAKDFKYSYSDYYQEEYGDYSYSEKDFYTFSTASNGPLAHIMPAIGIIVTKIFTHIWGNGRTSPLMMLHGARVFSLIIYIFLGYLAIKKTPILKKSMFVILLLPMSLYLASSVSYDGLLFSTLLLAFAEIMQLMYGSGKFEKKDFVLLILMTLILLTVKTIYSLFLLLLLFVPNNKFSSKKNKFKTLISVAIAGGLMWFIFKLPFYFLNDVSSNKLVADQFSFVLHNPLKTVVIILSNFWECREYLMYMMMGSFGLFETKIPHLIMYLGFIGLLIIFASDSLTHGFEIKKWSKTLLIILGIALVFIIYLAMYITWTPIITDKVGGELVEGVQGRYFLPLLIVLPYIFSNTKLIKIDGIYKLTNIINDNYYLYSCIMLLISIMVIILRFWV